MCVFGLTVSMTFHFRYEYIYIWMYNMCAHTVAFLDDQGCSKWTHTGAMLAADIMFTS